MEATVRSEVNVSRPRHVMLSPERSTSLLCCMHSRDGSSFPFCHGAAVICDKYGSSNLN